MHQVRSLLAFVEKLFGIPPLNKRDAGALPPISAFKGYPDLIAIGHPGEIFKFQLPAYNALKIYDVSGDIDGLALNSKTGLLTGKLHRPGNPSLRCQS